MKRSSMDGPSSEKSILPWYWIIEYLTSYPQVPTSFLYGLINQAPPIPDDLKGKVDELLALACLEELCVVGYEPSASTVALIEVDLSKTCQDVLECILQEASVSDIMTRAKPLRWHIKPFILHKRASMPKTSLQKLKDAILDGSCQIESSLKKMSGVVPTVDFRGVPAAARESEFLLPNAKKRKIARNPNCDDLNHLTDSQLKRFMYDALAPEEPATVNGSGNPENVKKVGFSVEEDDVHMSRDQIGVSSGDFATNPQKNSENGSDHRNPVLKNAANGHLSAEPPKNNLDTGIFKEKEPATVNGSGNSENVEKVVFSVEDDDVHMSRDQMGNSSGDFATNPQKNSENGSDHRNPVPKIGFSVEDDDVHVSRDHTGIPIRDFAANPQKSTENGSDHRNPVLKNAANGHLSAEPPSCNKNVDQDKEIDITMKRSDFSRSEYPPMGDSLDDWTPGGDFCVKCSKDDDQLLVCQMGSCFMAVHEKCLGFSATFDETGSFCCPSCYYSAAIKEYRECKKKVSLLMKDMAEFMV